MPDAELDFQIRLPAMPELCALMRSFLLEVLEVADVDPADRETLADRILELLVRVERLADERAGDDLLPIDIAATVDPSRVTIVSREHGVPIDDATIGSRIEVRRSPFPVSASRHHAPGTWSLVNCAGASEPPPPPPPQDTIHNDILSINNNLIIQSSISILLSLS